MAHATEAEMNKRAHAALDASGEKPTEVTKPTPSGIIDRGEYLEVNGFQVSKENL